MDSAVDPKAPLFFLSYAHSAENKSPSQPQDPNQAFVKFFDDLSHSIADLVSRPPGSDPGYIDRSMGSGVHWTDELLNAIGSCQVFVALISVRYFDSEWCGKEWYAFSRRKVVVLPSGSSRQTAIVPVTWAAPIPPSRVPPVVSKVQRFMPINLPDPATAALYSNEGIVGLQRMGLEGAYQTVVWRLAQHIAELQYSHWVEPDILEEHQLLDIFRE